jgi:uncharacterized LabA/DUF88 family protein
MWSTYKTAGKNIDMTLLLSYLAEVHKWEIVLKAIYLAYPETDTRDYNVDGIHKYATFLKKWLDFLVRKKPLKRILLKDDSWMPLKDKEWELVYQEKWNMDIELAIDVVSKHSNFDIMILLSGDSDFMPSRELPAKQMKKNIYIFFRRTYIKRASFLNRWIYRPSWYSIYLVSWTQVTKQKALAFTRTFSRI